MPPPRRRPRFRRPRRFFRRPWYYPYYTYPSVYYVQTKDDDDDGDKERDLRLERRQQMLREQLTKSSMTQRYILYGVLGLVVFIAILALIYFARHAVRPA